MTVKRAGAGGAMLALAAAIAGHGAMAQTGGLNNACRRELMDLCTGSNLRACVRERSTRLSSECRAELSRLALARRSEQAQVPGNATEIAFGNDPAQRIDIYPLSAKEPVPLVVFVHGGGWAIGDKRHTAADKAARYARAGFAFASVNYRLVPSGTVEQQASDIAAAIAKLRADAARFGFDPNRIVLMGHSAGAHLVALVGTDTSYFAKAGVPLAAVHGVVALDGAGYNVPAQMAEPRNAVAPMYRAAFGDKRDRQSALSPISHTAAPNVAAWLIVNAADRADSTRQSDALAANLRRHGTSAERLALPNKTHRDVNLDAGGEGEEAARIEAFVKSVVR